MPLGVARRVSRIGQLRTGSGRGGGLENRIRTGVVIDTDTVPPPLVANADQDLALPALQDGDQVPTPALGLRLVMPAVQDADSVPGPALGMALALPAVQDSDGVPSPVVAAAGVGITLPAVQDGETVPGPALAPSAVLLTLPAVQDADVIPGASLAPPGSGVASPVIQDADLVPSPALAPGAASITVPAVQDQDGVPVPAAVLDDLQVLDLPAVQDLDSVPGPALGMTLAIPAVQDTDGVLAGTVSPGAATIALPAVQDSDSALSPGVAAAGGVSVASQTVESDTLTDNDVGAASKTFAGVSITQASGAGSSGRYQLHALVTVSSASAGVTIDSVTVGSEVLAPDAPGQATASGRPAVRTFSAGEWAAGSQNVVVDVSGGTIGDIVVHWRIIEEVADACLPPYGAVPRSDTFNRLSVNPMWVWDEGNGTGASFAMVQNAGISNLRITHASNSKSHYLDRGANLQQDVPNGDFDVTVNKNQINGNANIGGLVAEIAADTETYVAAFHYSFGGKYFATYNGGSETSIVDTSGPASDATWIEFTRTGNTFAFSDSSDGVTFSSVGSTGFTMTVARLGFATGTYTNTAGTADYFSFINNDGPVRDLQDADTALQFLSNAADAQTSRSLAFSEDTTAGAGLIDLAIIAADDAAGTMSATGTDAELLDEGVTGGANGIRYAIVGALHEVSGTTSGETIGANWSGAAAAAAAGLQFRIEEAA